jgi:hypothetical protein
MTSSCSSGGKAPRPTGPRSILKASKAVLKIACVPKSDGIARTAEFVGNLEIGRLILASQAQDQPTTEDHGLRSGMRPDESLQAVSGFEIQHNRWRKGIWHDGHPCHVTRASYQLDANALYCPGQLQLHSDLRNGHLAEWRAGLWAGCFTIPNPHYRPTQVLSQTGIMNGEVRCEWS